MTLRRQLIFWSIALVVLIALLYLLNDVLLPFVAALALAYLLDPLVRRIQSLGINRALAAVAIVVFFIVLIAVLAIVLLPVLGNQLSGLAERVPGYIDRLRQLIHESNQGWLGQFVGEKLPEAQKSLGGAASTAAGWVATFLASLWSGGKALLSMISLLIITPIVTFYLLLDWDKMIEAVDSWLPRQHRKTILEVLGDMDRAIAGFVRGQALCCAILGIFYCAALILVGLNFGLLIGIAAAVLSFIPYVGTIVGLLLSVGVAVAQFWPAWSPIVIVVVLFAFGQFIEGNVLQPYFVGKTVGLPPVWLMFSLLAFGYLFGFVGLLVAVPVAAAIGVLTRFLLKQYLASPFYTGRGSSRP
ncbi:MAG TPA: AI-2E family transporter [Pseudorhodoplanes sp.]|nr:AI-2E family transporter [Pseudorhodoplanes sp.]